MDLFTDFSGPEYQGEQTNYPWIQLISKDELERSGFFISAETAARVNFKPDKTWSPFKLTFKGAKEPTPGYICQNPRFVVVARSRPTIWKQKSSEFVAVYAKALYNRELHILKTRYLLWLVGDKNQPIAATPLQFTTKGAFNGSFSAALGDYQAGVNALMAQHSPDKNPRNAKFFAMLITELALKLEPRGDEATMCCVVDKITPPNIENIRQLFLGTDPEFKALLEGYHDTAKKFIADFEGGGAIEGEHEEKPNPAKSLQDIEILPPTAMNEDEIRDKCVEIIKALGYDRDNGAKAIALMTATVGIGKLSLMNRPRKEQVLLAFYGLLSSAEVAATEDW